MNNRFIESPVLAEKIYEKSAIVEAVNALANESNVNIRIIEKDLGWKLEVENKNSKTLKIMHEILNLSLEKSLEIRLENL